MRGGGRLPVHGARVFEVRKLYGEKDTFSVNDHPELGDIQVRSWRPSRR